MFSLKTPGPTEIGEFLRPYKGPAHSQARSWAFILGMKAYQKSADGQKSAGEIRSSCDLNDLPRDVSLRALFLEDERGPVVRWVYNPDPPKIDPVREMERRLDPSFKRGTSWAEAHKGIITHWEIDAGDGQGKARQGYIRWSPDDGLLYVPSHRT